MRYHQRAEYKELTDEQRDELREWRAANPEESKKSGKPKTKWDKKAKLGKKLKTDKQIAAAIKKGIEDKEKEAKEQKAEEAKTKAFIMSLIQEISTEETSNSGKVTISDAAVKLPTVSLKSILKRASSGKS